MEQNRDHGTLPVSAMKQKSRKAVRSVLHARSSIKNEACGREELQTPSFLCRMAVKVT